MIKYNHIKIFDSIWLFMTSEERTINNYTVMRYTSLCSGQTIKDQAKQKYYSTDIHFLQQGTGRLPVHGCTKTMG